MGLEQFSGISEVIVVPTGPTYEENSQRAERGATLYLENTSRFVVISGGPGNETGRFDNSEPRAIYKRLREEGVPRKKIGFELKSTETQENVLNLIALRLNYKDFLNGTKGVVICTDTLHGKRFSMLADIAKKNGLMPEDFQVRISSEGIIGHYSPFKEKLVFVKDRLTFMEERWYVPLVHGVYHKIRDFI